MALRYPAAAWDPLGAQTEPRMVAHDIICLHTMVGSLGGTDAMFHRDAYGGTESHLGVGGDGRTEQWQDGMFQADANLEGTPRVFSVETADMGPEFPKWDTTDDANVPAWTPAQVTRLVSIVVWWCRKETHANCPTAWACRQVGVPCILIPDSKPGRRGVGYHRQGIDPWRVAGGERWSRAKGKGCPGQRRIDQISSAIIPRARAILAGINLTGGINMDLTDPVPGITDPDGTAVTVGEALKRGNWAYWQGPVEGSATDKRLDTLTTGMAKLDTRVTALENT